MTASNVYISLSTINWSWTWGYRVAGPGLHVSSDFHLWLIVVMLVLVMISDNFYSCAIVVAVMSVRTVTVFFCVNSKVVFFAARTAFTVLFVDFDLFLVVSGTILASWK